MNSRKNQEKYEDRNKEHERSTNGLLEVKLGSKKTEMGVNVILKHITKYEKIILKLVLEVEKLKLIDGVIL